jgi:hypothetical protein
MLGSFFQSSKLISQVNNFQLQSFRFATKKAGGSTKNGRDSPGQRLGMVCLISIS